MLKTKNTTYLMLYTLKHFWGPVLVIFTLASKNKQKVINQYLKNNHHKF